MAQDVARGRSASEVNPAMAKSVEPNLKRKESTSAEYGRFRLHQPMEGELVSSRTWSLLVRLLPSPIRWTGIELARFFRWFDRQLDQTILHFYSSPVFSFVTVAGIATVCMTFVLILSMGNPSAAARNSEQVSRPKQQINTRAALEKVHDWSTQDRWRIAHMFVPHKPKGDIGHVQIDTRLMSTERKEVHRKSSWNAQQISSGARGGTASDIDVRLELGRPRLAEQDSRLIYGTIRDASAHDPVDTGIRRRDPRLLVQASWERLGDCDAFVYAGLPVRVPHVRTVPEPIDDLPILNKPARKPPARRELPVVSIDIPPPRVSGHPDLSVERQMIRHYSVAGMFPPGSHAFHVSKRSEFPLDDMRRTAKAESEWYEFDPTHRNATDLIREYTGIHFQRSQADHDSDDLDLNLPRIANVMLRIFLRDPRSVVLGKTHHTKLIVQNESPRELSRIEVDEPLDRLRTVVHATPEGTVQDFSDDKTGVRKTQVHREADGLSPGETAEFGLAWIPDGGRHQVHHARVISHAAVSATTQVVRAPEEPKVISAPPEKKPEHPSFACDVRYLDAVYVGDNVEVEITVRNTGNTQLNNVQVEIGVPDQLAHPDGKSVVFAAGNLDVNGQNRTILKMSAKQVGAAVNPLRVGSAEQIEAHGKTHITVIERDKKPKTAATAPAPAKAPAVPSQIFNGCFCLPISMFQYSPMPSFDDGWFSIQ